MTKEEIVNAIRVCAKKLKRNPNKNELRAMAGISEKILYTRLGSLREALEAAGLRASGSGFAQTEERLLLNWATVARKLKKLPSQMEYQRAGGFSGTPFHRRYGSWTRVPRAFQKFARKRKLNRQWREVLKMITDGARRNRVIAVIPTPTSQRPARRGPRVIGRSGDRKKAAFGMMTGKGRTGRRALLPGRPVYGAPLGLPEMAYAPTNEMGVMFLFALMARRLGFVVQRLQPGYPDCEAMRQMAHGQCQRVWIEFEYESRNFLKHRHRRDGCDVIVCWKHNWRDCPVEVIELSKIIG